MKKGAKAYLAASIVSQVSALVRYVVLSRFLGPEELGLAALLILTSQFFDWVADAGGDRFVIQDEQGDDPLVQRVVHGAMFVRGLVVALGISLSGPLVSHVFHAPELVPALIALSAAPLIGGLFHADVYRAQRAHELRPASLVLGVSEIAALIGTGIAAFILRDHTAIIYGLVLRALLMVVVSHVLAKRPYRWAYQSEHVRRFLAFAVPLFINGLLLFLGTQGDRLLVADLGRAELGRYSAVSLLIFYPTAMALRFLVSIHLPRLSESRSTPDGMAASAEHLAGRTVIFCLAAAIGFTLIGPIATPLLFGKAFTQPLLLFAMLATLQTIRTLRLWPATISLALGRTKITAVDNAMRLVALPIAFMAERAFPGITAILSGFIIGEIAALVTTFLLANAAANIPFRSGMLRIGEFFICCACLVAGAWLAQTLRFGELAVLATFSVIPFGALLRKERAIVSEIFRVLRSEIASVTNWIQKRLGPPAA